MDDGVDGRGRGTRGRAARGRRLARACAAAILIAGCSRSPSRATRADAGPRAAAPAATSAAPAPAGRVRADPIGAPVLVPRGEDGHVNDHAFVEDASGAWHFFGIVAKNPPEPGARAADAIDLLDAREPAPRPAKKAPRDAAFGHAIAPHPASPFRWAERPFVEHLPADGVLWAPHVVRHEGTWHMVYCAGGPPAAFAIARRRSKDLVTWSAPEVLFRDGWQGRDPMLLRIEETGEWALYYTATETPDRASRHVVAMRRSRDLERFGDREIVFRDGHVGTGYGPTESPFVVRRGGFYYLFVGPTPYDPPSPGHPNWRHPGYVGTDVWRSRRFDRFDGAELVGHLAAHAPEVVRDREGRWWVSTAGIRQGGLYVSRLRWEDE